VNDKIRFAVDRAAAVLKELGAREVYVFGSAARGTMREDSDIDLAVTGLPPGVFFRAWARIDDVGDREIELVDLDVESAFTRYLREEGELLRVG